MRRFVRDNGLTLFFFAIFLGSLIGQAIAGHANFNNEQLAHHSPPISFIRWLTSSAFTNEVMENWQSEYLQFSLYILATVWLMQRGAPDSKTPDELGRGSDPESVDESSPKWARIGGIRTAIYSNSLFIAMGLVFVGSWLAQAITGRVEFNAEQLDHQAATLTFGQYLGTSDFWDKTLQNWQSEFLVVGSTMVFAIYLRQRGSTESKPVGAPDDKTGS